MQPQEPATDTVEVLLTILITKYFFRAKCFRKHFSNFLFYFQLTATPKAPTDVHRMKHEEPVTATVENFIDY